MKKILATGAAALLLACTATGPQKALETMAKAMDNNNPQAFLDQIDIAAYSSNYLKNIASSNQTFSSLNMLGKMLGLGSIDQLLGSVVNVQAKLQEQFTRGVASGELMAECREATTPDCPWVPRSLRDAKVIEIGKTAAIAKVTTPAKLTCWLALRKNGEKWQVVGHAVLENDARTLATATPKSATPGQTKGQDGTVRL